MYVVTSYDFSDQFSIIVGGDRPVRSPEPDWVTMSGSVMVVAK